MSLKATENRCGFRRDLKVSSEVHARTLKGRVFQQYEPEYANDRLRNVSRHTFLAHAKEVHLMLAGDLSAILN